MLNINKMCSSETPRVYKSGKVDRKRNLALEEVFKARLFLDAESFNDKYVLIRYKHLPEPKKSFTTAKNKEYMTALAVKAKEVNKKLITEEDWDKVKRYIATLYNSSPALEKLLKGGKPLTIQSKFDPDKKIWLKSSSRKKAVIETTLDIDYVRIKGNAGFFFHCLFGKSITTNNITFHIENYGLDILVSATKDILSSQYPKVNWTGWLLVYDMEQYSSFIAEINEDVVAIAKQAYEKRLITLDSCVEQKNFLHYDGIYGGSSGVVKLPISKRTIDLRTKNNFW